MAARLSLRTTDGESHETVRSALWHRAATARARVLSVSRGAYPRLEMQAPIVPAPGACRRLQRSLPASTGRQRGSESEALTASAPVAGGRITDMVINVKLDNLGDQNTPSPLPVAPHQVRVDGEWWKADVELAPSS